MKIVRSLVAVFLALGGVAWAAGMAETTYLLQVQPDGHFKVWYATGESHLSDDELMDMEVAARPEGGAEVATSAGPARAFDVKEGVVISLVAAARDKELLVLRDSCGGVKAWHSAGSHPLSEDELTELAIAALPGGSKRMAVKAGYAKSFTGRAGIMVVIWKPVSLSQPLPKH